MFFSLITVCKGGETIVHLSCLFVSVYDMPTAYKLKN